MYRLYKPINTGLDVTVYLSRGVALAVRGRGISPAFLTQQIIPLIFGDCILYK